MREERGERESEREREVEREREREKRERRVEKRREERRGEEKRRERMTPCAFPLGLGPLLSWAGNAVLLPPRRRVRTQQLRMLQQPGRQTMALAALRHRTGQGYKQTTMGRLHWNTAVTKAGNMEPYVAKEPGTKLTQRTRERA